MKQVLQSFLFVSSLLLSVQSFAITRVVSCRDTETQNLEIQFVLKGGVATLNVCPGDVCSDADMVYAQTFTLGQLESEIAGALHYILRSGQTQPVQQSFDVLFQGQDGDPVQVWIDGAPLNMNCN